MARSHFSIPHLLSITIATRDVYQRWSPTTATLIQGTRKNTIFCIVVSIFPFLFSRSKPDYRCPRDLNLKRQGRTQDYQKLNLMPDKESRSHFPYVGCERTELKSTVTSASLQSVYEILQANLDFASERCCNGTDHSKTIIIGARTILFGRLAASSAVILKTKRS